ncbi:MAG TPA: DUF1015 domain-containing protein [Nocardioidaceae bacterium]|nr:DUF1015 domain-containing protein [Nocardioidaceae bacterium]
MTSAHHSAGSLVHNVVGHVVSPRWAARVVSPLHDVISETERRAILADNPDSYLHVTSDALALPELYGDDGAELVQASALRRLLDLGAYTPVPEPALYVYRLTERGRDHTGVIASVAVEGFSDGRVLGHEAVQPERVAGLVRHYQRVPSRSELVALLHRTDPVVTELTARVTAQPPLLNFTDASGLTQSVWQAGPLEAERLIEQLGGHRLYIADGHHRVAAATRCWETARRPGTGTVLCALYPQHEIELHAFHRLVGGPVAVPALLERVAVHFDVSAIEEPGDAPSVPPGTIGLYATGRWCLLRPRERRSLQGVARLDVTTLHTQVLRPLLGIIDGDPRLHFIPDLRDISEAKRECDAEAGVLFNLHAPSIDDLISVAERGEVMSTKTTYVQPKPRTGLFLS